MESPIRRMSTDNTAQGYMGNEFGGLMNTYQVPFQQGMPYMHQFQPPLPPPTPIHQNQMHPSSQQQFQPIHQQHTTHHQNQIHQPSPQHFQSVNMGYNYHPQAQMQQQLPITMVTRIQS